MGRKSVSDGGAKGDARKNFKKETVEKVPNREER